MEDLISSKRKHSVDVVTSVHTWSSAKGGAIQPPRIGHRIGRRGHAFSHCRTFMEVRTQELEHSKRERHWSKSCFADWNLWARFVLLQICDREEERKRERDVANGIPRTLRPEDKGDQRSKLRMSMWVCACVRVCACVCVCPRMWVCPRSHAPAE